jgi:hypothetical protein
MDERPWRAVQHDLLGTMRRVLLDEYARQNALRPGAVHDPFDFRLTRGETSGAILGVQYETAEVAKAVVDNARHFARERLAPLPRLADRPLDAKPSTTNVLLSRYPTLPDRG